MKGFFRNSLLFIYAVLMIFLSITVITPKAQAYYVSVTGASAISNATVKLYKLGYSNPYYCKATAMPGKYYCNISLPNSSYTPLYVTITGGDIAGMPLKDVMLNTLTTPSIISAYSKNGTIYVNELTTVITVDVLKYLGFKNISSGNDPIVSNLSPASAILNASSMITAFYGTVNPENGELAPFGININWKSIQVNYHVLDNLIDQLEVAANIMSNCITGPSYCNNIMSASGVSGVNPNIVKSVENLYDEKIKNYSEFKHSQPIVPEFNKTFSYQHIPFMLSLSTTTSVAFPFLRNNAGLANRYIKTETYLLKESTPIDIAVGKKGNIWIAGKGIITKMTPNGKIIGNYKVSTCAGFNTQAIAIDKFGNVWVCGDINKVTELNSNGDILGIYNVPSDTKGIAVDKSGNAWVVSGNALTEINPAGRILLSYHTSHSLKGIAIDHSGNIWLTSTYYLLKFSTKTDSIVEKNKVTNNNSTLSNPVAITRSGNILIYLTYYDQKFKFPYIGEIWKLSPYDKLIKIYPVFLRKIEPLANINIAVARNGNIFVTGGRIDRVCIINSAGKFRGYLSLGASSNGSIAIDNSGNIWVDNSGSLGNHTVIKLIHATMGTEYFPYGVWPY
jgi:hypothetical protein